MFALHAAQTLNAGFEAVRKGTEGEGKRGAGSPGAAPAPTWAQGAPVPLLAWEITGLSGGSRPPLPPGRKD